MSDLESAFVLLDGRTLSYADFGAADGRPVLYFHGGPTSRLDLMPFADTFAENDVRIIAIDRPGYAASTPRTGRTRDDSAADAMELCDALGVERCAVIGYSFGGAYAIEAGAHDPDRITGVGVLAGTTDMGWPGAWEHVAEHDAELFRIDDADAVLARANELLGADGTKLAELMPEFRAIDIAMYADADFGMSLITSFGEGLRQGVVGYAADAYAEGKPWTFDPAVIKAPVLLLHGEADTLVPIAHARHSVEILPTVELNSFADHGHISIVHEAPALAVRLVM